MVQITGTITSPEAVRTHTDTSANKNVGSVAGGTTVNVHVGKLTNTGNVDQTVTAGDVSNLVNCENPVVSFLNHDSTPSPSPVVIPVGLDATLLVTVELPHEAIGSDPVDFGFDIEDAIWS